MVEDNSRHGADSYWYSIEHASRKSMFYTLFLNSIPPNTEAGTLLLISLRVWYQSLLFRTGVCHADELMYIFNLNLPFVLCDISDLFGKSYLIKYQTIMIWITFQNSQSSNGSTNLST